MVAPTLCRAWDELSPATPPHMIKAIASIVVVAIAGVLIAASFRPSTFHVERSASINASADSLFPMVTDFHRWSAWSPYEGLDPAMKKSYSGSPNGKGAVYAWSGNSQAGEGRMEIVDVVPSSKVGIQLDFTKPLESHNLATFAFTPSGAGGATTVTWMMDGANPYISKLMGMFMNMDQLIGSDFEKGLANMKTVAEGAH